jgi:prolipoprotein diacylglyceryltransferase
MLEMIFIGGITMLFGVLLSWGFSFLPQERWQMLAVVPLHKQQDDSWLGLNLTYYGFFVATSQLFAVTLLVILLGSLSISLTATLLTVFLLLAVCLPAARILAMIVEKKRHTFTIGGASFIGILLAPPAIICSNNLLEIAGYHAYLPLLPTLAALSLCYLLGEGLGRLGCISYGCCYGKPVCRCSRNLQRLMGKHGFIFTGKTKKAVYEGRFAGEPLVPIQAITACIYTAATIICCWFFLHGHYRTVLLCSIIVSQGWRVLSETLRADFRGFSAISAYQKMGVAAMAYVLVLSCLLHRPSYGGAGIGKRFPDALAARPDPRAARSLAAFLRHLR